MPELEVLPQNTQQELEKLGTVDIALGVPTFNNAEAIVPVIESAQAGLKEFFPALRTVLIHADGGSRDDTVQRVLEVARDSTRLLQVTFPMFPVDRLTTPYRGIPGRASAYRSILTLAQKMQARAAVLLDVDPANATTHSIEALARPVTEREFDLVVPYYTRHKFDGALITGVLYPMMRSLFGKRLRQPIGEAFGISARLVNEYLANDVWNTDVSRPAIDLWMTSLAVSSGFRVCQSFLGAKAHHTRDGAPDVSAMLSQVLGSLFTEMERSAPVWQRTRGSEPVPTFGPPSSVSVDPVPVNVKRIIESFRLGSQDLNEIWGRVLPPATLLELKKLARISDDRFRLDDDVWARILYDFSLAYRIRVIGRDHLLGAMTPLYLGWVASFILQVQDAGPQEFETRLETLCLAFERQKPYLISRWRWPDRFNP